MNELAKALRDLDEDRVNELVDEKLAQKVSPIEIINDLNEGIVAVGELYASGQYFLTELMFSGEIMQGLMAKLEPFIAAKGAEGKIIGTVVIGTVSGDIHDIGKNIVVNLLRSHRFKVIDLGVDVPAEKFVEMVQTSGAKVVGLSALLNSTYPEMKNVVEAFKEAGLRDQVKVIIGGTVVSEAVREFTGADAYATDAVKGIEYCKSIYQAEE
ncbi:MAG TPA: cobalamin-binding protein [Firmicutes bacterium]|jgi:methanogenic corrinoid protein MtbC1|nr:cobalamin-binding protein [Bacillota bacterium]HAA38196.1 cobalamin-binding protein [Bacillota bacterium]